MQKTFGHPEGPKRQVVSEQSRGRWRCRDVIEESGTGSNENSNRVPETQVNYSSRSPRPSTLQGGDRESGVDDSSTDQLPQNVSTDNSPESTMSGEQSVASTADEQHPFLPDFASALDSNSNASPRRLRSRATKTDHATESPENKEPLPHMGKSSDLWGVVIVVVAAVMCPYLLSGWVFSPAPDAWNWLHSFGRLVIQSVAVLVSSVVILIVLQGHFSSYQLRQWIARVFQLEMKEAENDPASKRPDIADDTNMLRFQTSTTTGDGDKENMNSDPERSPKYENEMAGKLNVELPSVCATDKRPSPSEAVLKADSEVANDMGGQGHVIETGRKSYRQVVKNMYRKFLLIRRKYKMEMCSLRRTDREASAVLSRVQLSLPVLEREKQALLAELEAIQKQHEEERRRNHDLLVRLHRLNQQFVRIGTGTAQGSATTFRTQTQDQPLPSSDTSHRSSAGQSQAQPQLYQHPNHHHSHHHHHHHHQQPQQQQQCSRPCDTGTSASHSLKEEVKSESAHNNRAKLRSTSLPL